MKKIELYLFVIVLFFMGGCDIDKEPIPAYIHIKPFTVNVNLNGNQGTKEQQITDAWVSDIGTGDFLGVYELPATLPIIADGNTKLTISPGILENGIRVTPNIYSLLTSYEIEIDLAPNVIDTIQPVTQYDSRAFFHYKENFESSSNTLDEVIDTTILINTNLTSDPLELFEGSGSCKFVLDEDNPKLEVATSTFMELPTKGDLTVMELHYKNEGILQIALLGYEDLNASPVLTYFFALNPQPDWNKVYIDLTNQLVGYGSRFKHFKILFGAQLPDGKTTSTYLIDNIKVLELPDD